MNQRQIIKSVQCWVETVVIDLNLCPFAKREFINNKIRFIVTTANTKKKLLFSLHDEIKLLTSNDEIETTLLIHPAVFQDFYKYNQFLLTADELIKQMDSVGIFQIASFHPKFQFANTGPEDVENYTNRSPYPILHILREASLNRAINSHPNIHEIPTKNIHLMREMGIAHMKGLLKACLSQ